MIGADQSPLDSALSGIVAIGHLATRFTNGREFSNPSLSSSTATPPRVISLEEPDLRHRTRWRRTLEPVDCGGWQSPLNEGLLIAVALSEAAVPLPARTCHSAAWPEYPRRVGSGQLDSRPRPLGGRPERGVRIGFAVLQDVQNPSCSGRKKERAGLHRCQHEADQRLTVQQHQRGAGRGAVAGFGRRITGRETLERDRGLMTRTY